MTQKQELNYANWQTDCCREQLEWLTAKGVTVSEKEKSAYMAGHEEGWRKLLSLLKLHGVIVDAT